MRNMSPVLYFRYISTVCYPSVITWVDDDSRLVLAKQTLKTAITKSNKQTLGRRLQIRSLILQHIIVTFVFVLI